MIQKLDLSGTYELFTAAIQVPLHLIISSDKT